FVVNWATIRRTKSKKEYQQLILHIDVHAHAKLRANVQPKNLDELYETFGLSEKVGMYIAPEKRERIWLVVVPELPRFQ
ncbi:M13-type metalloendopeptidase, partial [Enterococcus faecium]